MGVLKSAAKVAGLSIAMGVGGLAAGALGASFTAHAIMHMGLNQYKDNHPENPDACVFFAPDQNNKLTLYSVADQYELRLAEQTGAMILFKLC